MWQGTQFRATLKFHFFLSLIKSLWVKTFSHFIKLGLLPTLYVLKVPKISLAAYVVKWLLIFCIQLIFILCVCVSTSFINFSILSYYFGTTSSHFMHTMFVCKDLTKIITSVIVVAAASVHKAFLLLDFFNLLSKSSCSSTTTRE